MSKIEHVKIKDWEICCNDFLTAVVNGSIEFDYDKVDLRLKDTAVRIDHCAYCGKEIVYPLAKPEAE